MRAGAAPWVVFFSSLAVYQANLRPVASTDSIPAALLPFSIVLDGNVRLDRFGAWLEKAVPGKPAFLHRRNGHYYSRYPIGQAVLLTPAYAPVVAASGTRNWPVEDVVLYARILEKLFAAAIAAATAALFYLLARRLTPPRIALAAAAAFAFATPLWATNSQALWQHTGGVLLIVAALLWLVKWTEQPERLRLLAFAGVASGLALTVRPTNALLAGAVAAVLLWTRAGARAISCYLAAPVICAGLVAAYNWQVFGDLRGGYAFGLSRDLAGGVAGLLFSPSRGLFIYCPFLLLALFGFAVWSRAKAPFRLLTGVSALFLAGHVAVSAVSPMWWGGHCWGPRLMSEAVPFLTLMTLPAMERLWSSRYLRAAVAGAVAWSVFLQFVGAFCYPRGYWDDAPAHTGKVRARLWDWRDNPVTRTLTGGLVLEPYAVAIAALAHGRAAAARKVRQYGMRGF